MKNVTNLKRSIATAFVMLAVFSFVSSFAQAQTASVYKRGVMIEEFTGTWCGYCPRGAWFMDSLQTYMPNNAIEIAWHNADEMTIANVEDTIEAYFAVGGFPNVGLQRTAATGINDWSASDPLYTSVKTAAKQTPLVDFRIVNVAYNSSTGQVDFDLDVTPFDMKAMTSEDTAKYVSLAVLTEDGLVYDQHNYGLRGLANPIPGFVHENVARAVGGSVLGNKFTLGTKDANPTLPARIHYSMTVQTGSWNASEMRIKSFVDGITTVTVSGKKYSNNNIYNAAQSKYLTSYPQTAPDAIWVVLPNAISTTSSTKPTNIVWANGGNASSAAKLEYSIDNGTTWNLIVASTTNSPYAWTIPQTAYGTTAMIRASDAANPNTKSNSEVFKTPGIITVLHPAKDEVIDGGTQNYSITFGGGNYSKQKSFEYSLDNGVTWKPIGSVNSDATNYVWGSVPNTSTTTALLRIKDNTGIIGVSGNFTIKQTAGAGAINNLTLGGVVNNKINTGTDMNISWTPSGNLGANTIIEYSTDNTITWTNIATIASDQTSTIWKTPNTYQAEVFIRVKGSTAGSATSTAFAIGSPDGNIGSITLNGVVNHKIARTSPMTISWTATGTIGTSTIVDYSTDGLNWTNINTVTSDVKTTSWTTPDADLAGVVIRVKGNIAGLATSEKFDIGAASGVSSSASFGGYSITNYPNPMTAQTNISFVMADRGVATITVHDQLGREIATVANSAFEAGSHLISFDASKLATGIYTCTFEANGVRLVKKMSVTK